MKRILGVLSVLAISTVAVSTAEAVPGTMSFTARISDGSGPVSGNVALKVEMFDAASGGSWLWGETHGAVTANNGLVHVDLGNMDPVNSPIENAFTGGDVWLELTINGTVQSPRLKVGTVPYAVAAATAEKLGTLLPSDLALANHTHNAGDISSGTLDPARYSCYADLGAEGYLDNNNGNDLLTRSQADTRYFNASNISSGTLANARYNAYDNLSAAGRLDNNSSSDLLTRSQADTRYYQSSSFATFTTSATNLAADSSNTVSAGSGWEFCALHYYRTEWAGRCQVIESGGVWSLQANNYPASIANGSRAYCGMICLNLN